jgi:hypothetical protein
MGHSLIARLPKSLQWRAVTALLNSPELTAPQLAWLTSKAARERLLQLRGDPSLTYCFWLLTRLASASRGEDFIASVNLLGIEVGPDDTALQLITRVTDRAREELAHYPESGPFGEMASLALRHALVQTVGTEGRSLLGSAVEDLERAFRRHSTAAQFGELSQRFFADFMARTLRYYVDRELPHAVGKTPVLASIGASSDFTKALDLHTYQSARIVETFAADWFSKHHFQQMGAIGRDEAEGFVAHALSKLRSEIKRGRMS